VSGLLFEQGCFSWWLTNISSTESEQRYADAAAYMQRVLAGAIP
jgi:hypothetical protein